MFKHWKLPGLLTFLCLAPAVFAASVCPAIMESALDAVDAFCQDAGRNQACYGNVDMEVEAQPDAGNFKFDEVGDIVNVSAIQRLKLSPMDEATDAWGVALMNLQANLPDTLPGQNITFLLFGDVEIENAVPVEEREDFSPMQAFFLRTGIGDAACEEAPDSGLLIQTPDGSGEVLFNINGVDVHVGSTVLFQAEPEGDMMISPIEGSATMDIEGEVYTAIAGTRLRIPMTRLMFPAGRPRPLEIYEDRLIQTLPIRIMKRRIEMQRPLTRAQMRRVLNRIRTGEALCGEAPFPPCEKLAAIAGGAACIYSEGRFMNRPRIQSLRQRFCEDAPASTQP